MAEDVVEKDQKVVQPVDRHTSYGVKGKTQDRNDEMRDHLWGKSNPLLVAVFSSPIYIYTYEAGNYLDHFLESKKVVQVAVFEGMNYSCHVVFFITLFFFTDFLHDADPVPILLT